MKLKSPKKLVHSMRERWQKISIKWRILSIFVLFIVFVLILLWLFQTVFLNQFYENIKQKEILGSSSTIEKAVSNDMQPEDLKALCKQEAQRNQLCILILDSNGNVYGADASPNRLSTEMGESSIRLFLNFLYQNTQAEGGTHFELVNPQNASSSVWDTLFRSRAFIYNSIRKDSNGSPYMIFLYSVITPLSATVSTIRSQLFLITGILLVFAVLLAFYLSKHISKPIIQINDAAKELATGDYNVTFREGGYREISELARTLNYAEHELGKVEHLQRELIANISHDLRTPLTMICGYAEVMRDLPGENTPENIQVIIDEATRLTNLVNDVLDISKLESGTQKLEKSEFSLTNEIRETTKRYQKLTDCILTFESDRNVTIFADELKISQVLYNLINNAINYTGTDRKIQIRQLVRDHQVTVEVTDTGEGIPSDKLHDIWDRYYKVDKEHKRAQIGTGLGLSIVKSILDMHNGTYGVRSAIGVGSTFWFRLPILSESPVGALPEGTHQPDSAPPQS